LPSSLFDTIVYIEIGPEKQKFGMHKALLCRISPYFQAALTGNFEEAETGIIVMDDESPEVFTGFNSWLYSGSIFGKDYNRSSVLKTLSSLYIFANKKLIPALQDYIIDVLIRIRYSNQSLPNAIFLNSIWSSLSECPKLCNLLADWYVERALKPVFLDEKCAEQHDVRFIIAIANTLAERLREARKPVKKDLWRRRCRWHVHDIALPCQDDLWDTNCDSQVKLSERLGTLGLDSPYNDSNMDPSYSGDSDAER